ncbi:unnamed protein product [Angiostrongylus costaricensis]|uniref:Kazal-like domain-containing protein n=1 Tax=Angiostrongylus costaricensis TaxID=334426 RepID=A0A0R3PZT6_ANGCS|nr:unnamed protein product [Angiostrongylus costaricensis]
MKGNDISKFYQNLFNCYSIAAPPKRCGQNEVFDSCGAGCQPSCRDPHPVSFSKSHSKSIWSNACRIFQGMVNTDRFIPTFHPT